MNRSNNGRRSCGPGLASGCPWNPNAALSCSAMPCKRSVKQRCMSNRNIFRQRFFINRKTMILARDQYLPGCTVLNRMICTMVAKFHLHRFRTSGQRQQLMAKADAKYGHLRIKNRLDRLDCVITGLRITWPVRQKNAIRGECQHFRCRCCCRPRPSYGNRGPTKFVIYCV